MPTLNWWDSYNRGIETLELTEDAGHASQLSSELCILLSDVEHSYQTLVSGSSIQQDLSAELRVKAWSLVAVARGWTQIRENTYGFHRHDISLIPAAEQALPLLFRTLDFDSNLDHASVEVAVLTIIDGIEIGLISVQGNCESETPVEDIEDLDKWILSIIDGSFEIDSGPARFSIKTSFLFESTNSPHRTLKVGRRTARAWIGGWNSRLVVEP